MIVPIEKLTVIMTLRRRDAEEPARLRRCLNSLARQTAGPPQVLLVDSGSLSADAAEFREIAGEFNFCRYFYLDTRGMPWNKPKGFNYGILKAETDYVVTADLDLIYGEEFFEQLLRQICPDRMIFAPFFLLPKGYSDWQRLCEKGKTFKLVHNRFGAFQCVFRNTALKIRGFDEFYYFWGREDVDYMERVEMTGTEVYEFQGSRVLYHQWHPPSGTWGKAVLTAEVHERHVPFGYWGRMCSHYLTCADTIVRNDEGWSHRPDGPERPIFNLIDPETGELKHHEGLRVLKMKADDDFELKRFVQEFKNLPPGQALAVCYHFGQDAEKRVNRLHAHLWDFIFTQKNMLKDYYWEFPLRNNASVFLKASGLVQNRTGSHEVTAGTLRESY